MSLNESVVEEAAIEWFLLRQGYSGQVGEQCCVAPTITLALCAVQPRALCAAAASGAGCDGAAARVLLCLSGVADSLALREIRKGLGEGIAEWEIKNDLATLKHLGLVQVRGHARWARWVLS